VPRAGEPFAQHLTDRYMHLANQALKAARAHDPEALVTTYAYDTTLQPPRRERLDGGVVLGVVTRMNAPFERSEAMYRGWKDMGMNAMLFRPNDLCVDMGLPLGHEKRMFEHQALAIKYGARGMDHDCCYGFWTGVLGINFYVLSRSHIDPSKDFEYWEDHYAEAYGAAKQLVKDYHRHWRKKFDEVILPADLKAQGNLNGVPEGDGFLR